jgi:hypothetical protein
LGLRPRSGRRPIPQVKTRSGKIMHTRCSTLCQAAQRPRGASPVTGLGVSRPDVTNRMVSTLTSRLGAGVRRPDRRPRPRSRARRAARRPGSRARCHRRRRVTARRHASHLQTNARVDARLKHPCTRASAASTGQKRSVNSARRGGVLCGSAGQWPSMELAGRARAKGVRSARAA